MRVFHHSLINSTNAEALRLSEQYRGEVLLVSAELQTHGRGRQGRRWESPPGGAWFSVAVPAAGNLSDLECAPLLVGLSVLETLQPLLPPSHALALKWPNDVLLDGRKVAGILCERELIANGLTGERPSVLVCGVGINVNVPPPNPPQNLRFPATCLHDALQQCVDIHDLITTCATRIASKLTRADRAGLFPGERGELASALAWMGQRVEVAGQRRVLRGVLSGVDSSGRLVLQENGIETTVSFGDVTAVREAAWR